MPWSPEQINVIEAVEFHPQRRGYHREDVERMRKRALLTMRRGHPLPNLDAMPLRRVGAGLGLARHEVEGVRTLLAVWAHTTPVEDPRAQAQRERDARIAALAHEDARAPQWSSAQLDLVREKQFTRVGRQKTAYQERDVNAYLDSVVAAMRQGLEIPDPAHARFDSAGMRRGYDCQEVDEFLDMLAAMKPAG